MFSDARFGIERWTSLGGLVHVFAGAIGISALVMACAKAFTLLKDFEQNRG
jgi:hypothetical protein